MPPYSVTQATLQAACLPHSPSAPLRRYAYALVLIASASGCISFSPPSVSLRPTSAPAEDGSIECALAEAARLGYSVAAAESGVFFRAERAISAFSFDAIDVAEAQGRLTVTASRAHTSEDGRSVHEPEESATADAEMIVRSCSTRT